MFCLMEKERRTPIVREVDVDVAGMAGTFAALVLGRRGARTILIDSSPFIGARGAFFCAILFPV